MKRLSPRVFTLLACVTMLGANPLFFMAPAVLPAMADPTPDLGPLNKWITRQSEVRTVQADFTQTRTFHLLHDPLASPGHLWFSATQGFRWELGEPPKTIVLKKGDASFVIQPAKKHAERLAANPVIGGSNPLPMMNFPLATSFDDFNRQFEVLSISVAANRCHAELLPRDPQARKYLAALKLDFDTQEGQLLDFELALRDGSSLRNEFSNVRLNGKIDPRVFDYDLTGYEVTNAKR